jgi:hypothetical protein
MFSFDRIGRKVNGARAQTSIRRRRSKFIRPCLEQLEDRRLLSDYPLTASGINIAPVEGASFSGAVASFTDADPTPNIGDFSATIAWGDGATSTATIAANGSGGFNVNGSHAYGSEGSYATSVTINDAGGSTATATAAATVPMRH